MGYGISYTAMFPTPELELITCSISSCMIEHWLPKNRPPGIEEKCEVCNAILPIKKKERFDSSWHKAVLNTFPEIHSKELFNWEPSTKQKSTHGECPDCGKYIISTHWIKHKRDHGYERNQKFLPIKYWKKVPIHSPI